MSGAQDALRLYVASSRERLQQLLQRLQWTENGTRLQHRPPSPPAAVSEVTFEPLPPSCLDAPQHSLQLNEAQLQQLLGTESPPQSLTANTFEDLQVNFSAAQKLLIYEYVLQRTPRQQLSFEENANLAELVTETKKAHKKQRRYRKSKPTLQEEMHQLVELQMQALQRRYHQQQQEQQEKHRHHYQLPVAARERFQHQSDYHRQYEPERRRRIPSPPSRSREWRGIPSPPSRSRDWRRDSPFRDQRKHSSRRHKERSRSRRRSRSRSRHKSKRRDSKRERSSSRSKSPRHRSRHRSRHQRSNYN